MNKRLLTEEEIQPSFQNKISVRGGGFWEPQKLIALQDAKTHEITLREIGKEAYRMDGSTYLVPDYHKYRQAIEALKRGDVP